MSHIQDLREGKLIISYLDSPENLIKLNKALKAALANASTANGPRSYDGNRVFYRRCPYKVFYHRCPNNVNNWNTSFNTTKIPDLLDPTATIIPIEDFSFDEFELPKKWYVERNSNNANVINRWLNANFTSSVYLDERECISYPNYDNGNGFKSGFHSGDANSAESRGYKKITFEQFKQYVLKQPVDKKPIGYKSLIDLFAGTDAWIFKNETTLYSTGTGFYHKKDEVRQQYWLPKEIVETWTPVTEKENENYTIGNGSIDLTFMPDGIYADNKKWEVTDFEKLLEETQINGYKTLVHSFQIGCTLIVRDEIITLLKKAKEYYK